MSDVVDRLRAEYVNDLDVFGVSRPAALANFSDLLGRYREPHRHYHDLDHVAAVLRTIDGLAEETDNATIVRVAAWYHDAVYDPAGPGGDEAASAHLAAEALAGAGAPSHIAPACERLILVTATHEAPRADGNGRVLIDADLAILSSPPDTYDHYVRRVRAEYAHVEAQEWRRGRAGVLHRFLDRHRIYMTERFRTEREAQARANLTRELLTLE